MIKKNKAWTTVGDLKAQILRYWTRGDLLRACLNENDNVSCTPPLFPIRLKLKAPLSAEITNEFEAVRQWIAQISSLTWVRIEWRTLRHSVLGEQKFPDQIWIDDIDHAAGWINKRTEIIHFKTLLALTHQRQPELISWLCKKPLRALDVHECWPHLLDVVAWLKQHPRPDIYLRQVDIPGIDTKFIETHRDVLAELLDLALPPAAINGHERGIGRFAARYGFRGKPAHIRFRLLDEQIKLLPGSCLPDIALDAENFSALDLPIRRIFITENEINFLAFPLVPQSIVLFGAGYGWRALANATWLSRCAIHYWGDIDTNGFAILNQLRHYFPDVQSFLMDEPTLLAHQNMWGKEKAQIMHDLPLLTDEEKILFYKLRDNRIGKQLRLEQEKIGFQWMCAALERVVS